MYQNSYNPRKRRNSQEVPPPIKRRTVDANGTDKMIHRYNLRKRRNDQHETAPPIKRKAVESTTKLVDLNFDCFVKIFENLNNYELINLVEANEMFKDAATYVFILKYGDTLEIRYHSTPEYYLRVLRCFGHAIKKVHFMVGFEIHASRCIEAIIEHCGQNLLDLQFTHTKPVYSILYNARLSEFFWKLSTYFPNLKHLAHHNDVVNYVKYEKYIFGRGIPSLKQFTMKLYKRSVAALKEFILSNSQLETLTIKGEYMVFNCEFARFIVENLPRLKTVNLENFTFIQKDWAGYIQNNQQILTTECVYLSLN